MRTVISFTDEKVTESLDVRSFHKLITEKALLLAREERIQQQQLTENCEKNCTMGWFPKKEHGRPVINAVARSAYTAPTIVKRADCVAPEPMLPSDEPLMVRSHDPVSGENAIQMEHDDEYVQSGRAAELLGAGQQDGDYTDVENATSSFSRNTESDPGHVPSHYESPSLKQNHLNSMFNGHLMKWKFQAEEGTAFIRVPAFFGALGLLVTSILAFVYYPEALEPHSIVMTSGVVVLSIFVLILDGRFLVTNPLSLRANMRNIITRNFNILRFLWGRGLLYIIAGTLNVAQTWLMTMISGSIMIALGILSIVVGIHASRKFAALRNSLADEAFLMLIFGSYDYDNDGYLEAWQFARLLVDLGMELDDRYTLKAFNAIDREGKRKVSYEDFSNWWTAGYIERGRRQVQYDDES